MTREERERLRTALAAPGFDVVRFAAVDPGAPATKDGFQAWLAAGHHADMNWLPGTAEKRADPRQVLPGARTMIVLGVNARPAEAALAQQRWAKYALWSDYHDTIGRGLRAAETILATACGLTRDDYRAYVDTGPVIERGWAAAAGIGWQGKNAMLISRDHGNWLLLAAVLVRCDIPPDEPLRGRRAGPDLGSGTSDDSSPAEAARGPGPAVPARHIPTVGLHCGSCTRCLASCPTNAFPRPGWVDARRCIAYHTIENRGMIPRELRAGFGGRVFGCDVCLDVCPWNRFAQAGRSVLVHARTELVDLTLLDLLTMDETRFREVFRKSPVKRVKLAGLLRNACVAAGNWHDSSEWHFGGGEDRSAVARAVERLCGHESPVVRAHAVWALNRLIGGDAARVRLASLQADERDAAVLAEYQAGLTNLPAETIARPRP